MKDAATQKGSPPYLALAAGVGNKKLVDVLLSMGADPNGGDHSPAQIAVENGHSDIAIYMLEKGEVPRSTTMGSLLHHCAKKGDLKVAEYLLANKVLDVNSKTKKGLTPLHQAAKEGQAEMVKFLIKNGAEIDAVRVGGYRPISYSIRNGHNDLVKLLTSLGANIEGESGGDLIFSALILSKHDIVKLLLKEGAGVNYKNAYGRTPLHEVSRQPDDVRGIKSNVEIAKLLIEKGADINARDRDGVTPLGLAEKRKVKEIAEILRSHGAK